MGTLNDIVGDKIPAELTVTRHLIDTLDEGEALTNERVTGALISAVVELEARLVELERGHGAGELAAESDTVN
ncbi:hypothetical protein ACFT5B_14255 [Luteimicrobium sp. NPDC057192]|uniref:hypothetical protein n=1 Tax=Luteimicrobium sp. NPDC057192 TaxID=3346042 RepID=UPI003645A8A0